MTTGITNAVNLDHLIANTTPSPGIQIEGTEDLVIKIETPKKEADDGSDLIIPITPKEDVTEITSASTEESPKKSDDDVLFSLINTETKDESKITILPEITPIITEMT